MPWSLARPICHDAAMRLAILALALVACGGSSDSPVDAAPDVPSFSSSCSGACQTTALTATMQSTRVLDHAYFGINVADDTLRIEAYRGGAPGCPTMSSPTPDYTLVLGRVTRPASTATSSSPANMLDYQGDLLGGQLGAQATMVTLTPVAAMGDVFVAFDAMLTFSAGTVNGHVYATHCTSLDG
jgi:hypothetical protein